MSDNALKTATDKYRPTVTPVTSVGNKSATQTGKPIFTEGDSRVSINDAVPVTFEDSTTTKTCLLYTSPSPRDQRGSRMPSSA